MARSRRSSRCIRCRMRSDVCICAHLSVVDVSTRIVVVIHHREEKRTTNTGRLAALVLPDAHLVVRGRPGAAPDLSAATSPDRQTYVLFPGEGVPPLSPEEVALDGRPVTLVVPDGNWRQASKVPGRVAELAGVPQRTLPDGPPSRYHLRREVRPGGLATFEAIARALGLLHGAEVAARLMVPFDAMVAGTLISRGRRDVITPSE